MLDSYSGGLITGVIFVIFVIFVIASSGKIMIGEPAPRSAPVSYPASIPKHALEPPSEVKKFIIDEQSKNR